MVTSNPHATGDFVAQALQEKKDEQGALRRYKGTIISVVETLVTVLSLVLSFGFDLPEWVAVVAVAIIGCAESLGIRVYKPAVTSKQQEMVREAIAAKIDAAHGVSERPL